MASSKGKHRLRIDEDDDKMNITMYQLTLNTNIMDHELKTHNFLYYVEQFLLGFQDGLNYFIINRGAKPDNNMIIRFGKIVPEIGKRDGKIHAHVTMTIRHNSNISLNYRRLNKDWDELVDGGYFHAEYMTVSAELTKVNKYEKKSISSSSNSKQRF